MNESCYYSTVVYRQNNSDAANGSGQRSEKIMKQDIHPEYHPVVFMDSTTGFKFSKTKTLQNKISVEYSTIVRVSFVETRFFIALKINRHEYNKKIEIQL